MPKYSVTLRLGIWNVSICQRMKSFSRSGYNDDCFNDHFPLKPVLPGVAIMEAQHSLARELALRQLAERGLTESFPVLCRAEKVKFRLFIQPGDQMAVEATVKSFSEGQCSVATRVTVGGKNAASVLLHFELPDRAAYMQKYILGR